MSDAQPRAVSRSVQKANIWINDMAGEMGTDDEDRAYSVMRAYLHALRDRLTIEESAQLAAQLPELIRGIYYEGWDPTSTPVKTRKLPEFVERMADETPFNDAEDASRAITAAASVLRRHVTEGEIEDIRSTLPKDLQRVVGEAA
jgi:uncharacterized protein (DUF2267 family)